MPLIHILQAVHAAQFGVLRPRTAPYDLPLAVAQDLVGRGAAKFVDLPALTPPGGLSGRGVQAVEMGIVNAAAGGASFVSVPADAVSTGSFLLAGRALIRGNALGVNGALNVSLLLENYSGEPVTLQVYLGGQIVWDDVAVDSRLFNFSVLNQNSTQSQIALRGSIIKRATVNTEADLWLECYVQRPAGTSVVRVSRLQANVVRNDAPMPASVYQSASGAVTVELDDLALFPLPARVTQDPARAIRTLCNTAYVFPSKFFSASIKSFPINSSIRPPISTAMLRTLDVNDLNWSQMQTAVAAAPYANPTGAAPAGISAANLAKMDALFSAANQLGAEMVVNLLSGFSAAPAWLSALGVTELPLSIPPAGANRTTVLNSLAFYVRFLCERYRGLYPTMDWWIEPLNEPNNPGIWSGAVGDLIALCSAIKTQVDASGGARVKCIASSWTDPSGITFVNPGSAALGGLRPTLHEYLGSGGWGHFDVITYHIYRGTVAFKNINSADSLRQSGLFQHDLSMLDPLNNTTSNGRYYSVLGMLGELGLGTTIVPGVSTYGNKPLWITECGDAYASTRDRNWFIRLALVASCLGVTRYVFYYYANREFGALPEMEIDPVEYQAAADFLAGKNINWVNANSDFTRVAASINGRVMVF